MVSPVTHVADHATETVFEWFGHNDTADISQQSVEMIAKRVFEMEKNKCAVELRQEVYRQSRKDPIIQGLGTTRITAQRPAIVIPRQEFDRRAGVEQVVEETIEQRTEWKRDYPVVIIRPYSKAEPRRWRFEHGGREFSATMRDPDFLAAIKDGHTGVEIGEGVEMQIDLRIKMERIGGIWHEKELDVMRVTYPVISPQILLQLATDKPRKSDQ